MTDEALPAGLEIRNGEHLDNLVTVLELVRRGTARTRPELVRSSGLGRALVTQRVGELIDLGLLQDAALGPSTGGRAPRRLGFRADAGHLLVAQLGATGMDVGVADLMGQVLHQFHQDIDVAAGPEAVLSDVEELFDRALAASGVAPTRLWGVGIGVPGPVEFASGRPVAPPIMPGWDRYPLRERFAQRYGVPVWVDNDVNLLALGELRAGSARGVRDLVYIKVGTGIGAGLVSGGRLHRGAQGCAGDIGHVSVGDEDVPCRCGKSNCLEALAGGAALVREGSRAGEQGRSARLAAVVASGRAVAVEDVATAARHGDAVAVALVERSGRLVGETVARIVNFFNPSLILLGGSVVRTSAADQLLATVRETVYRRSLPLATRDLRLVRSSLDEHAGLLGAAAMVTDELLSSARLRLWIGHGSPVGRPELADEVVAVPA